MQTGVKSFGCENRTAQESPIQSWNLIGPSVVWASKSGAVSLMYRAICNCSCRRALSAAGWAAAQEFPSSLSTFEEFIGGRGSAAAPGRSRIRVCSRRDRRHRPRADPRGAPGALPRDRRRRCAAPRARTRAASATGSTRTPSSPGASSSSRSGRTRRRSRRTSASPTRRVHGRAAGAARRGAGRPVPQRRRDPAAGPLPRARRRARLKGRPPAQTPARPRRRAGRPPAWRRYPDAPLTLSPRGSNRGSRVISPATQRPKMSSSTRVPSSSSEGTYA